MLASILAVALAPGADLDREIAVLLPTKEEQKWLEIPWRLNLAAAQKEATDLRKPLFVWMMNGHPMGCT